MYSQTLRYWKGRSFLGINVCDYIRNDGSFSSGVILPKMKNSNRRITLVSKGLHHTFLFLRSSFFLPDLQQRDVKMQKVAMECLYRLVW